uniref:Uncharacterized protein n=1 Tax=uncultured Desulfobacterium sp. TaxID=201089 RepID=E1YBH9_9BACT|nr:unknown protein [uncultured Desulfobacterium sp.]
MLLLYYYDLTEMGECLYLWFCGWFSHTLFILLMRNGFYGHNRQAVNKMTIMVVLHKRRNIHDDSKAQLQEFI